MFTVLLESRKLSQFIKLVEIVKTAKKTLKLAEIR
jgi:hypothetical protein